MRVVLNDRVVTLTPGRLVMRHVERRKIAD